MTFASIRANALSPALYAQAVPDGTLHDVGLAAWEMPPGSSQGQLHFLHSLDGPAYDAFLVEPYRSNSSVANRGRLEQLKADVVDSIYSKMDLEDLSTVYGRGTSLCLQNCTLSPYRIAGVDSYFDYGSAVGSILDALWEPRRLYVHMGMGNVDGIPFGELNFNNQYALECRPAENIYRIGVNPASVTANQFVQATQLLCADLQGRPWLHTFTDITHPSVIALCLASIDSMVAGVGASVRYILQGEVSIAVFADIPALNPLRPGCFTSPIPTECTHCEPTTNYSARMVTGFRNYLQYVLGLTIGQLNTRWGQDEVYGSFADIDPLTIHFCPGNPVGCKDWLTFHSYLVLELGHLQQHRAKLASAAAQCSTLRFGIKGAEQSWLAGDFAAVGDWIGYTVEDYLAIGDHHLEQTSTGARLSGAPLSFAITAPPYIANNNPPGQGNIPLLLRSYRTYTRDEVRIMFRDCWHAGSLHIGYLKGVTAAFGYHPSSREAVLSSIEDIVALHAPALEMSGPYQRMAIHVEEPEAMSLPDLNVKSARTAYHLGRLIRDAHTTHAVFESARVLNRTLSRWWLSRSLVVVPYHSQLTALRPTYVALFPSDAPGGAVFVEQGDPLVAPAWCEPTALVSTSIGRLYRVVDAGVPVNCWAFITSEGATAEVNALVLADPYDNDEFASEVGATLQASVLPYVRAAFDAPFIDRPVTITSTGEVLSSYVTDGVNFTVAVSNVGAGNATVSVSVSSAVSAAMGVTHSSLDVSLAPRQTEYIQLTATLTGIDALDISEALASAELNLAVLTAAGYDTAAGTAVLTKGIALLAAGRYGRAVAAYTAAVRMVYLIASHSFGDVAVAARRIGLEGEAQTLPVAGARVQIVWRLNAGEEGPQTVTDIAGNALLSIGAPATQRWDFTATTLVAPPATADDLFEVHVTDPLWGSSSRISVAT